MTQDKESLKRRSVDYLLKAGVDIDLTKTLISSPRRASFMQWESKLREEASTEKEETLTTTTSDIKELKEEIKLLKEEMDNNTKLLKISNDLILQLIGIFRIQESQSYYWSDEWLASERDADSDIKQNSTTTLYTKDQIIDFLRS